MSYWKELACWVLLALGWLPISFTSAAASDVRENNLVVPGERVGFISKTSTEEELHKILSSGEIRRTKVQQEDAEYCATEIFPNSGKSALIFWGSDLQRAAGSQVENERPEGEGDCESGPFRSDPVYVALRSNLWWRTSDGQTIGAGMSLADLEKVNGKPVAFVSCSCCGDGAVVDWNQGRFSESVYVDIGSRDSKNASYEPLVKASLTYVKSESSEAAEEEVSSEALSNEVKRETTVHELFVNFKQGRRYIPEGDTLVYALSGSDDKQFVLYSNWPDGKVAAEFSSLGEPEEFFTMGQSVWTWCGKSSQANKIEKIETKIEKWGDGRAITRIQLERPTFCEPKPAFLSSSEIPKQTWQVTKPSKRESEKLRSRFGERTGLRFEKIVSPSLEAIFFVTDSEMREPYEGAASGGYRLLRKDFQEISKLVDKRRLTPLIDLDGDNVPEFFLQDDEGFSGSIYRMYPKLDKDISRHYKGAGGWAEIKKEQDETERQERTLRVLKRIIGR